MEKRASDIEISGEELLKLIPQREPMILIDALHRTKTGYFTTLAVRSHNIFCEDRHLTECGMTENMAQSAAAREGFICRSENREIPLGMIGSVEKASFLRLPLVGETLTTFIEPIEEIFNIVLLSAVIKVGDETIAECKLKIYLKGKE